MRHYPEVSHQQPRLKVGIKIFLTLGVGSWELGWYMTLVVWYEFARTPFFNVENRETVTTIFHFSET